MTCEGYYNGPRRVILRSRALSNSQEDVKGGVENMFTNASPRYSRSPKLVQGLVQTPTLPTTCQEDLSRSFGRLENLPRLPELDARGPGIDAPEHSILSPAAGGPPQDSPQMNLTVLPPMAPHMRCHQQHLPEVSTSSIAQSSLTGPNRPQPVEPSALVPMCISRQELIHPFPGPLRYGLDDGIYEDEARKVLSKIYNLTQDSVHIQSSAMLLPKGNTWQ